MAGSRRCSRPGAGPRRGRPRPGAGRRCSSPSRSSGRTRRPGPGERGGGAGRGRSWCGRSGSGGRRPGSGTSSGGPGRGRPPPRGRRGPGPGWRRCGPGGPRPGTAARWRPPSRPGPPWPACRRRVEGPGRQPGPEHRPGRGRVAGGHPEGERVVRPGARGGPGPRDPLGREQGGGAGRPGQEQAATDRRRGRGGLIGWGDVRHDQAPLGRLEAADHSGSRERWPGRVGEAAAQGTVCGQTRRVGRSGTTCGQPRERLASVRYASPPGALAPRGGISVRPRRWWARAGGPNGRTT